MDPELEKHSSSPGALKSRIEFLPPPSDDWNMASELLVAFKRHAHRTLLVDAAKQRSWTGKQLLEGAGSIATGLIRQVGLKPGQVVFLVCDHSDDEILLALGTILAGGAFYGATPDDGLAELKTLCELVLPSVIVTSSRLHWLAAELRNSVAGLERAPIVWVDDPCGKQQAPSAGRLDVNGNEPLDASYWADVMRRDRVALGADLVNGHFDEKLIADVAENRIDARSQNLTYMLTSGSTGRPKVVASTHEQLVYGLYSMMSATRRPLIGGDHATRSIMPLAEHSVLAGDLPLDHGAGINSMLLSHSIGAKFIVMPSYDERTFWRAVHDYRITSSIASTTFSFKLLAHLRALISAGEHTQLDLSCFAYIACVGSKLAFAELIGEINKTYAHLFVCQGYGCTEVGFIAMLSPSDCRQHLASVGHLYPGIVAKVVDRDTGRVCGANERGELHVWARSKFTEYKCHLSDDPASLVDQCHDPEGFYITGDQVHYDDDGRLYVHGRFKDTLFLAQDWKILPAELEEIVDKHPLVAQSAVIGTPDPELPGCDAPRAFVTLISGDTSEQLEPELRRRLTERDEQYISEHIYKFFAERTAAAKHLRGGVRILREFPRVGLLNKIDRKALKSMG